MAPFFDLHGDPTMDPYTILGIPPTATEAEIKRSYRMQMLQLHPDKLSPNLSESDIADISDKFHNVKDAYEFLTSPLHLASRRLYMTKMASRRAEYERREAYLRRNGGVDSRSNSVAGGGASSAVPSGYSTGGGGAAGMAGTGMPTQQQQPPPSQQHRTGNSYAMPKSKATRHRAKSEPEVDGGGGDTGGNERRRHHSKTNGGGYYKNMGGQRDSRGRSGHNHHNPTTTKHRETSSRGRGVREQNGYKSDSHTMKTKSQHRERRSSNANAKDGRERPQQHRGKSEEQRNHNDKHYRTRSTGGGGDRERRTKEKRRPSTTAHARDHSRDNRERERERERESNNNNNKRRGRATSAPARYSSKSAKYKEDMRGSSNSNSLPKEFFCPLTKRIMKDPVKDTEGNTYEREAIERWLRVQSSSPITNRYLSLGMIRPDKELKRAIYKVTGKPRSKSQARTRSPPSRDLVSGRVLIDSYLREISSKSTLSVSLDGMGICAFSYRRITFVIEVPITPNAGFMVYSSFDGEADKYKLSEKIDAWNKWFMKIGRHSRVSHIKAGQKTVFTLKGSERDMSKCELFQKTLEYFVEMSLKLHNLIHPMETKAVENVCLTRTPVPVT